MKKVMFIMLIIVVVCIAFAVSIPVMNNIVAENTAKELESIPLPEQTNYIERISRAGKLAGNGNGMQYFGAILIKSELSVDELKAYYSKYADNEWECVVEKQIDKKIQIIEHGKLEFQSAIGDNYYIVYSWGNNSSIFADFDLRGH